MTTSFSVILSILVAIGALTLNVWYPKAHIDNQINVHRQDIEAIQHDDAKMQTIKIYNVREDNGLVVITDPDEEV